MPLDPAQQAPYCPHVQTGSDHGGTVEAAVDGGESRPALQSAAGAVLGRLDPQHDRVARERVPSGQYDEVRSSGVLHRESRQAVTHFEGRLPDVVDFRGEVDCMLIDEREAVDVDVDMRVSHASSFAVAAPTTLLRVRRPWSAAT